MWSLLSYRPHCGNDNFRNTLLVILYELAAVYEVGAEFMIALGIAGHDRDAITSVHERSA